MSLKVQWCDEFVRLDPISAAVLDGDGEKPLAPPVKLLCGRNAFASFQLSVGRIGKGQTVHVVAEDLSDGEKGVIPAGQFDVFVEWYHLIGERWYPEICVPQEVTGGSTDKLRRLNRLPGDGFAGFWVDLFVPAEALPGRYTGNVTVVVDRESLDVPVELTVHAGKMPAECCLDVSCNNYADAISSGWADLKGDPDHLLKPKYRRVEKGVFRAAHEHRMFLSYLAYGHSGYVHKTFAPPLTGEGARKKVASWTDWDKHFGGYLDGSAFKGTRRGAVPVKRFYTPLNLCWPSDFLKFGQAGYEAEWRAVGAQMVDHFKKKGWTKTSFDMFLNHKQRFRFFPWDTEEARFKADNNIQRYFSKLWKGTFDRETTSPVRFDYTLGTTWLFGEDIQSDLADFIDVFIGGAYDMAASRDHMDRLHRTGRQMWACLHSGSTPHSVRAAAFPPLMMWMVDADGFMPTWCTLGSWGESGWFNPADQGGTTFFYSGSVLGTEDTYASLRMKVQRNALQTVDEFNLASGRIGGGKDAVKHKINEVLSMADAGWYPGKVFTPGDNSRFTEEPPLAGWEKFSVPQYRQLRELASTLVSGGAQ